MHSSECQINIVEILYDSISALGFNTYRCVSLALRFVIRLLSYPARLFFSFAKRMFFATDSRLLSSLRSASDALKYFRSDVKGAKQAVKRRTEKGKYSTAFILVLCIKRAFRRHKGVFKGLLNTMLPIVMAIALILTISYWSNITFALEVVLNGESLGYIASESVYIESRSLAEERLNSAKNDTDFDIKPEYRLAAVSPMKLDDAYTMCDKILESSETNLSPACGIAIDGELLCAVANETDAKNIFNSILESAEFALNESGAMVSFAESIEYIQGLYPANDSTIWDAFELTEALVSGDKKYINVQVTRTEQRMVNIEHEIISTKNDDMFEGDTRVIVPGSDGEALVTELVTSIDGKVVSTREVSRIVTKQPVAQEVEEGTASSLVVGSYGNYSIYISGKGFTWPTPECSYISSRFGTSRSSGPHKGIDLTCSGASGRPIVASMSGTVETAGSTGNSYGYQVVIDHGNGIRTRYAHCLAGSIRVYPGQYVTAGELIAKVGSTGNSTGAHLHFEIIVNGTHIDPLPYLT